MNHEPKFVQKDFTTDVQESYRLTGMKWIRLALLRSQSKESEHQAGPAVAATKRSSDFYQLHGQEN